MSGHERDPVKYNEQVQRGRAADYREGLIEQLRLCKVGLEDTLTAVTVALENPDDIEIVAVPNCPEKHCIEHTLRELKRSASRLM